MIKSLSDKIKKEKEIQKVIDEQLEEEEEYKERIAEIDPGF